MGLSRLLYVVFTINLYSCVFRFTSLKEFLELPIFQTKADVRDKKLSKLGI